MRCNCGETMVQNHIQDVILESPRGGCEASAGGENKQRPPSRAAALKNASYGEQVWLARSLYTLHSAPYTLHPANCILHPAPCTLIPKP